MSLSLYPTTALQALTSSWRPVVLCRQISGDRTLQILWKNGAVFAAKSTSFLTERVPLLGFPKEKITLFNITQAQKTLSGSILDDDLTSIAFKGFRLNGGGGCTSKPQAPAAPPEKVLDMGKLNEEMEGLTDAQLNDLALVYLGKSEFDAYVAIQKRRLGAESTAMCSVYVSLGDAFYNERMYFPSIGWYNEAVKLAKTHTKPVVDIAALETKKQEAYRLHCDKQMSNYTFTKV